MRENENFQIQNENAINDFINVKNLKKNKKRPKGKKIIPQNYNNTTTKYTTDENKYEQIKKEINYNFSNFNLIVKENYNLSDKDVKKILNDINTTDNNKNISEQKSPCNEEKKEKGGVDGDCDLFGISEEDDINKQDIKKIKEKLNKKTDILKDDKNFNVFDESKMLNSEGNIDRKYLNINLKKKRKRTTKKKYSKKKM